MKTYGGINKPFALLTHVIRYQNFLLCSHAPTY
jgi:hypothetical protein